MLLSLSMYKNSAAPGFPLLPLPPSPPPLPQSLFPVFFPHLCTIAIYSEGAELVRRAAHEESVQGDGGGG